MSNVCDRLVWLTLEQYGTELCSTTISTVATVATFAKPASPMATVNMLYNLSHGDNPAWQHVRRRKVDQRWDHKWSHG